MAQKFRKTHAFAVSFGFCRRNQGVIDTELNGLVVHLHFEALQREENVAQNRFISIS